MDQFVRRENVKHYLRLLETVCDEARRRQILALLEEERRKQAEAGDLEIAMNSARARAALLGRMGRAVTASEHGLFPPAGGR